VTRRIALFLCLALALPAFAQTTLNGAGATFPYPIYSKWFSEYHKAHSDVQVNYQSIGSGGGIRQVLGKITTWNDKVLTAANPGVNFPNQPIVVVHRSDGSGTSYIFTDYLSKVSADWKNGPGKGTSVKWPVGLGGKGNEGVAGMIRQMEGSIGYVELIYALQNKITYGSMKNPAGEFVKASLESVTTAAASVKSMPADFRVSITNAPGKGAYPISSFTWLLIPTKSQDPNKGKILTDLLNWCETDGQKLAADLSYAPLPDTVVAKVKEAIKQVH
jgi:phosphate transport system substrate-binding protein